MTMGTYISHTHSQLPSPKQSYCLQRSREMSRVGGHRQWIVGAGFVGNTPASLQLETIKHSGGVIPIPVKGSEAREGAHCVPWVHPQTSWVCAWLRVGKTQVRRESGENE